MLLLMWPMFVCSLEELLASGSVSGGEFRKRCVRYDFPFAVLTTPSGVEGSETSLITSLLLPGRNGRPTALLSKDPYSKEMFRCDEEAALGGVPLWMGVTSERARFASSAVCSRTPDEEY